MKGAVMTIEERLSKVEVRLRLILDWALDNSNPHLVRKLRKYADGIGDDSLSSVEGTEGADVDNAEVKDELEEHQDPIDDDVFMDDDHGFPGEDDASQIPSSAGNQSRSSREASSRGTIDQLNMTPVVRLTRISTTTTGSLSAEVKQEFVELQIESSQVLQAPLPYSCNQCEKAFTCRSSLLRHKQEHPVTSTDDTGSSKRKGAGTWICGVCYSVFPTHRELIGHREENMHYKKRAKCNQCDQILPSRTDLLRHQREIHFGESPNSGPWGSGYINYLSTARKGAGNWTCAFCKNVFPTSRALTNHRQKEMHYKRLLKNDDCNKARNNESSQKDLRRRELEAPKQEERTTYLTNTYKAKGTWKCLVCNILLPTYGTLRAHKKKLRHFYRSIQCDLCSEVLPSRDEYSRHNLEIHDRKEPPRTVPCSVCNSVFPTYEKLREHRKKEMHYKQRFQCKQSFEVVASHSKLLENQQNILKDAIDGGLPESKKVDTCQEMDSDPCDTTDTSIPEPEQKDASQNSKSDSNQTIATKVMIDEIDKPENQPNNVCSKVFPKLKELADSRKLKKDNKKGSKNKTIYSCNVCNIDCPTWKTLIAHKKKTKHYNNTYDLYHPMTAKGWHTCPDCNYKCYGNLHYNRHRRSHSKERPYMCSTCGESFKCEEGLYSHNFLHTGEPKPFICKYCGSGHVSALGLREHERLHEGTREKLCRHCNRKFVNLRVHIQTVHDKVRKFECHLCDHKFKRGCHLKRHVATHNNPNRRVKGYHIERPDKPFRAGKRTVLRMCEDEEGPSLTSADIPPSMEASNKLQ